MINLHLDEAKGVLLTQGMLIIALAPMVALGWHQKAMLSFVSGGLIAWLPNLYLYRRVFFYFGARSAQKIFKSLYWGEGIKMLLSALGFIAALQIMLPLWLLLGYISAQFGFAMGIARQLRKA